MGKIGHRRRIVGCNQIIFCVFADDVLLSRKAKKHAHGRVRTRNSIIRTVLLPSR